MSLIAPSDGWFSKRTAKDERIWILIAFVLCVFLFIWMIMWHVVGKQNPSNTTYKTTTEEFGRLHDAYVQKHMVGMDNGIPVVKPEPNSDVILMGQMWRWSPVLILQQDEWYNLHISSTDIVHGFSLQPSNMNFQIYPEYDYVLRFKPTASGEYKILCNEYCGIGHHIMIGKIVVVQDDSELSQYGYDPNTFEKTRATAGSADEDISGWSEAQLVEAGETAFNIKGCNACHKTDGTSEIGPALNGLFGSTVTVTEDGARKDVVADDAYIALSISDPQRQVKVGFEEIAMASLELSDNEMKQMIAYIKSIK